MLSQILRWLLTGLGTLALVYLVLLAIAWKIQDRLALPGPRSALPMPSALGISDGVIVSVVTADSVTLHGWYLPPNPLPDSTDTAPGLVWFYGNMETIEGIGPVLLSFRPPGMGMLVLDYRGYGTSGGKPTERGVYLDAEAAWDYLSTRPEIDSARIAVYGRSIGSAVAFHLATVRPVRAVVLDSPLSSARDMAKRHYRYLPSSLVRLSLDNVSRAKQLTAPLLIFHGTEDWIAPISMGQRIAEIGGAEEVFEIHGAGHNETYALGGSEYVARFHEFLTDHLR